MAKYRKRPVVVEARQFLIDELETVPAEEWPAGIYLDSFGIPYVVTIHGNKTPIEDGDWILPEPDGVHYYPCKDTIFRATYEPVA